MNKKVIVYFILILFISVCIFLSGCSRAATMKSIEASPSNALSTAGEGSEAATSFEGIYKYDYEGDTQDLTEDHYIILTMNNGSLEGRYYGTSDDFDKAREGYYPGFYVSDMKNLQITNNEIAFSIELPERDMFSKPVNLKYKAGEEVPISDNPQWVNSQIIGVSEKNPNDYVGEIVDGKILLHIENSQRAFIKLDDK